MKQNLKLLLILVLCSSFMFSFAHVGVLAYDTFLNKRDIFDEGTKIGNVEIAGKNEQEALQLVTQQWTTWQQATKITVHYKEKTAVLDNTLFTFNEAFSFNTIKQGQDNPVAVQLESLDTFLQFLSPTLTNKYLDIAKLKQALLVKATMLESGNVDIQVEEYLRNPTAEKNHLIGEVQIAAKLTDSETNVINEQLQTIEIAPLSEYSLLKHIERLKNEQLSTKVVSYLATGMYEVILPTNFSIVEREISETLPNYAKMGYEAKVNIKKRMDFIFKNENHSSYRILLKAENNRLTVSLKGPSFLYDYKIVIKDQKSFASKTIVQFNPQLARGQKIIDTKGKAGQSVKVIREIYDEKGNPVKKVTLSEDFYPPVHQVEVHSLMVNPTATDTETQTKTTDESVTETPTETPDSKKTADPKKETTTSTN